jgi:uncharacterized OB-fold protein
MLKVNGAILEMSGALSKDGVAPALTTLSMDKSPMTDTSSTTVPVLRCVDCGTLDSGPRDLCPKCFGALAPVSVAGDGTLMSWTMIRRPPAAFRAEGTYAVALVKLDAGCQITGRLANPDEHATPGKRVTATGHKDTVTIFTAG